LFLAVWVRSIGFAGRGLRIVLGHVGDHANHTDTDHGLIRKEAQTGP
jgi:hypothetical protein